MDRLSTGMGKMEWTTRPVEAAFGWLGDIAQVLGWPDYILGRLCRKMRSLTMWKCTILLQEFYKKGILSSTT